MMRKPAFIAFTVVSACFTISALAAPGLPKAADVIKKMHAANAKAKSYSFTVYRFDQADEFVLKRNEDGLKSYKAIIDKLSVLTKQSPDVPEGLKGYKQSISHCLFIKPFSVQMKMEKSDFVPAFLQGATVIYRPDVNDEEVFLKEPHIGMLIRNPASSESSTTLISNWTYELMELDCAIANGGQAKITGREKYGGKQGYVLEVSLKKGRVPWAVGCGGKPAGVPENAYTQLNREMDMMADRIGAHPKEPGVMRFWVDESSWLIMKKEVLFGKTAAIRYNITNLKLDSVKPSDMENVKKKQ